MHKHRRAARELALRILYQVDVGRRPVREALYGALDQLGTGVRSGLTMALRQVERQTAPLPPTMERFPSQTRRREDARVRRHVIRAVTECVDSVGKLVDDVISHPQRLSVGDALLRTRFAVRAPVRRLRQTLRLSALPREDAAAISGLVDGAVEHIENVMHKRLQPARDTADVLIPMVVGTVQNRELIDERIAALSEDWPLDRQPAPDRNVLRLAAYELLFSPDVPTGVIINEAVTIAKRYGTEESGRFVNGVLAALAATARESPIEASS